MAHYLDACNVQIGWFFSKCIQMTQEYKFGSFPTHSSKLRNKTIPHNEIAWNCLARLSLTAIPQRSAFYIPN